MFLKNFYFFIILFIYLFILAALGLHCCTWAFLWLWRVGATLHQCTGISLQWLLFFGVWAPDAWASVVVASGLSSCGSWALERRLSSCGAWGPVALWHVGSSRTRAWTHVPCVGRRILNHCATREAPQNNVFMCKHDKSRGCTCFYNHFINYFHNT